MMSVTRAIISFTKSVQVLSDWATLGISESMVTFLWVIPVKKSLNPYPILSSSKTICSLTGRRSSRRQWLELMLKLADDWCASAMETYAVTRVYIITAHRGVIVVLASEDGWKHVLRIP